MYTVKENLNWDVGKIPQVMLFVNFIFSTCQYFAFLYVTLSRLVIYLFFQILLLGLRCSFTCDLFFNIKILKPLHMLFFYLSLLCTICSVDIEIHMYLSWFFNVELVSCVNVLNLI